MRARYEQDRLLIDIDSESEMDRLGYVIAGELHCGDGGWTARWEQGRHG
jgi:hypothetical protein